MRMRERGCNQVSFSRAAVGIGAGASLGDAVSGSDDRRALAELRSLGTGGIAAATSLSGSAVGSHILASDYGREQTEEGAADDHA